jgi:hypothetical protein
MVLLNTFLSRTIKNNYIFSSKNANYATLFFIISDLQLFQPKRLEQIDVDPFHKYYISFTGSNIGTSQKPTFLRKLR